MKKIITLLCFVIAGFVFTVWLVSAQDDQANSLYHSDEEITFDYQQWEVTLSNNIILDIPESYKFVWAKDATTILVDLWGNRPEDVDGVLGLLFPANETPYTDTDESYVFVVSYADDGYVSDEDADNINYDELMSDLQESNDDYSQTVGWADTPSYDKEKKVMYRWLNIHFSDFDTDSINYDVRVLGRRGILRFTAISWTGALATIISHREDVLNIGRFATGSTYADFDPTIDKLAEYTLAGLVAGGIGAQVLSKLWFFAFIAKFWKVIFLAIAWFFTAFGQRIKNLFTKKTEETTEIESDISDEENK